MDKGRVVRCSVGGAVLVWAGKHAFRKGVRRACRESKGVPGIGGCAFAAVVVEAAVCAPAAAAAALAGVACVAVAVMCLLVAAASTLACGAFASLVCTEH
eukprot:1160679-Pelagomonas_calceolata.AAC.11